MKKFILVILLSILFSSKIFTQVITFERTDVEGKKADFVTATYSFGIDIRIDSIKNCSNVAFELSYNQVKYVKFSEYNISEDWNGGVTLVVERQIDTASDKATLAIEAGTGFLADTNSPNNPKIIHLEFVVAPNATHGQLLEFSISKIKATYYKDSVIELLIPKTFKIPYQVHSYIEVWPGDANCDGLVDPLDWSVISLYLTEPRIKSRAFKRPFASILWQPQICIAWDELAATYADCDGNGFINTSDWVVVAVNDSKKHNSICNPNTKSDPKNKNKIALEAINDDFEVNDKTITIPINIDFNENNIVGAAGIIDYSADPNVKIIGMKTGGFFNENNKFHYYINPKTNIASFCIVNHDQQQLTKKNNTIAHLYIETHNDNKKQYTTKSISDFVGFDGVGNVKTLTQTLSQTSINENDVDSLTVLYNDGEIQYFNNATINKIKVINYLNDIVGEFSTNSNNLYNIGKLPSGVYFVIASDENKFYTTKFFVTH